MKMRELDWNKIKEVFALAVEQPAEKREKILREVCADDSELQAEVESLLAASDESSPLIERSEYNFASVINSNGRAYEGKEFGHYRIIREIGRGGMGTVFLAERNDGAFEQKVALKIVRRSFADEEIARRFRRERQILASLNHPNIARLLDGGVSNDGEPFLAMEYVEGTRIDDFCKEKNLSTRERLRLFMDVCNAIAYAHQNLIVHRDIKPSNILVTTSGTPKLLDFGIAKLLDAEQAYEQTQTAFRAFTPEYASPEQIKGEQITTASDTFSLGVLLRELLTVEDYSKEKPLPSNDWQTKKIEHSEKKTIIINIPTNQKAVKQNPESKNPKPLSSELKNIIAMAGREEPERRYASVGHFAEDVQRYLNGLPVRAQRDRFTYRTKKFFGRNKLGVVAATLVAVSLIIGFAVALWQANVARKQRDHAERRFKDVRQLSNALLFDIAPKIERVQGSTEARQALVNQSLKYLDSLANESTDDWSLQSELATAYEKIGSLQGDALKPNLGDFRGAITSYEKAQAIRRMILEKQPGDIENKRLLAENLRALSIIRWNRSDARRSFENSLEALKIYENLISENPDSTDLQTAYLETQIENAQSYSDNNQHSKAIPLLRHVIEKLEELRQKQPHDTDLLLVLVKSHGTLGSALSWNNQQAEGEAEISLAIEIAESLVAAQPNDANLRQKLWATYLVASGIYEGVDDARSIELSEKALKVVEETIRLDKANAQARHNLARTFSHLGAGFANLGKLDAALSYLEKSLMILSGLVEKDPQNTTYNRDLGILHARIGDAKYKKRDLTDALVEFEKAAAIYQQINVVDESNIPVLRDTALAYKNIGYIQDDFARTTTEAKRQQHLQMAKENYRRALDILLKLQSQNALAEFDRKFLEEMQTAVKR